MSISDWLALATLCLLGAISPGPSLAVVSAASINSGKTAGMRAAVAHGAGVGLYAVLTVTGLALLITQSPQALLTLQILGALYLLYLGVQALRQAFNSAKSVESFSRVSRPALDGFLVAFLNPKLAVFMLALFSQFLSPAYGLVEKSLMVATVGAIDTIWYLTVATLFSQPRLRSQLQRGARYVDAAFGVLLIALALLVLLRAGSV